jgi:glutamate racemase
MINEDHCQVIVIACNTVSTTLVQKLREDFNIPFIALEPMVKPASEITKSKIIAVCATPTTLASKRYHNLKENYAKGVEVLEPDCSEWAMMIQNNQLNSIKIDETMNNVLDRGADVVVLACTHYHWIEDKIKQIVKDRAEVLQPEAAIINRLKQVLEQLA